MGKMSRGAPTMESIEAEAPIKQPRLKTDEGQGPPSAPSEPPPGQKRPRTQPRKTTPRPTLFSGGEAWEEGEEMRKMFRDDAPPPNRIT